MDRKTKNALWIAAIIGSFIFVIFGTLGGVTIYLLVAAALWFLALISTPIDEDPTL